jgi:hypothetical protein
LSSRIDALEAQEALRAAERKTKPDSTAEPSKAESPKTEPPNTEPAGGDE